MELSTIAKPYAQAIFEIAEQSNSVLGWSDFLAAATEIMADKNTKTFIASPSKSKNQKFDLISALIARMTSKDLSKQEAAFINLVLNNDRSSAISSIANVFESTVSNANKSKNFKVISAYELSEDEQKAIVKDLTSKHKTTVSVETEIDVTLKGGVIIKEGDKVIDTSIKAKVDALGVSLSVN
ncbi:F0F1 ATP synthase subunit delta [Candidatus Thioglobus sp.]|nr:F0F1 ATP synthase subunit delta [Candidatus Thioglobus sp.]